MDKDRIPSKPVHVVVACMSAWYVCSMVTLFANKTILTTYGVPVHALGIGQMTTTCLLGAVKVYGGRRRSKAASVTVNGGGGSGGGGDRKFYTNLFLVGLMRGATVVLGLVSLQHVAASFVEAGSNWYPSNVGFQIPRN